MSDEPTDWIATADRLDEMLRDADVLVISAALTTATEGLIGARELDLMKENAILINVARGEIIDEAALYAQACLPKASRSPRAEDPRLGAANGGNGA